jgi:hypothetical protein
MDRSLHLALAQSERDAGSEKERFNISFIKAPRADDLAQPERDPVEGVVA